MYGVPSDPFPTRCTYIKPVKGPGCTEFPHHHTPTLGATGIVGVENGRLWDLEGFRAWQLVCTARGNDSTGITGCMADGPVSGLASPIASGYRPGPSDFRVHSHSILCGISHGSRRWTALKR
jgi:hypothetical protein